VGRYQKGKTNLDFTEARDSEWQWHQLSHMQVCTLFQTDNNASTSPLSFLQAGCPSCRPTNSVKALKMDYTIGISESFLSLDLFSLKFKNIFLALLRVDCPPMHDQLTLGVIMELGRLVQFSSCAVTRL